VDLDLDQKVALVTGASRGLGAAIALGLLAEGASVAVAARSQEQIEALASSAEGRVETFPVDLGDEAAAAGLVGEVVERFGKLDILVNNAGIAPAGPYLEQETEVWKRTMAVNVIAPMLLAREAGRHFIARGEGGKIVNVASTTGVRGKPGLVAYSASKGAMVRMTEALAAEWARDGIQVNAIAPGAFETEAQRAVVESPELLKRRVRRIPARRMAKPEEIVGLACLLASWRSDFITGSVYVIDGGEAGKL
jgi:2-deoxy-D-gluconate 3-dehydrogenase